MKKLETIPVHKEKYLAEGCCEILNKEWPRSKTARLHMLEKSCESLPYNLALVECVEDTQAGSERSHSRSVIGHSRLCKVHGIEKACFIESVIIDGDMRGRGLGRVLMAESELTAQRLGFEVAYLTTRDKQDFYSHIGYDYCEPIISLGSASKLLSEDHFQCLFGRSKASCSSSGTAPRAANDSTRTTASTQQSTPTPSAAPPPPPPPLPPLHSAGDGKHDTKSDALKVQGTVYWMKKQLQ